MSSLHSSVLWAILGLASCGAPKSGPVPPAAPTASATSASSAAFTPPASRNDGGVRTADTGSAESEAAPTALDAIAPTVRLLEPGAAPRRALRYRIAAGTTEYGEIDMKIAMELTLGTKSPPKVELPTVRTTLRLDAKEPTSDGNFRVAFKAESVEVLKDLPGAATLQATFEKELSTLVGMHGTCVFSPRGVVSSRTVELPPGADEKVRGQLERWRDSLDHIYAPFPEEAVGSGGRWEVGSRIAMGGAMVDTKVVYTVTKLGADSVEIGIETTMSAPAHQAMKIASAGAGTTPVLDSLSGHGTGHSTAPLTHLIGAGTSSMHTEMSMHFAMNGKTEQVKNITDMKDEVRPRKASAKRP